MTSSLPPCRHRRMQIGFLVLYDPTLSRFQTPLLLFVNTVTVTEIPCLYVY